MPEACVPAFTELCISILEPVRAKFGILLVTSGFRSPQSNADTHGQSNSEHIATETKCAADFYSVDVSALQIFDWMRMNATLPYHQLILEHGKTGDVVHVSMNKQMPGIRSVLEGATHNSEDYTKIAHADYDPNPGTVTT